MNFFRPILLTAALTGLSAIPLLADGAIRGVVVVRHKQPLPGAVVRMKGPQGIRVVETNSHGMFNIYGLTPGKYWVTTTMDGYNSSADFLLIRSDMTRWINARLCEGCETIAISYSDLYIDPTTSSSSINLTREELEPFALGRTLGDWVDAVGR